MADGNAESIAQRIQIARRDAEALKDRIKRKKDELADTTRKSTGLKYKRCQHDPPLLAHCRHI
jgi:guanine nucleotide-binding protein G(I)/G(S)/G(T) subunit beta-1